MIEPSNEFSAPPKGKDDVPAMQKLWRFILVTEMRYAIGDRRYPNSGVDFYTQKETGGIPLATHEARQWMGGKDFRMVCEFSNLDPDYVMDKYLAFMKRRTINKK